VCILEGNISEEEIIKMIGTAAVMNSVDWHLVLLASILSGIISLLTSIAGLPELK